MIKKLKALFESAAEETAEQLRHRLHLTAAALLLETSRADFEHGPAEQQALQQLLSAHLALAPAEVEELLELATQRLGESTSLYEFTREINDHYSAKQKLLLIDAMWQVAYADEDIHKYEEHLIRRVAELTYVPHGDYIRSKLRAGKATPS